MHLRRRDPSAASAGQRPLGRRTAAVSVLALAALTALLIGGSSGTSAAPAPTGIGAAATDAPVEAVAMKAPKTPKPPKNAPTTTAPTTVRPTTTTPRPTTTTPRPTTTTPRPTTTTPQPTTTTPATTAPSANATFDRVVVLVNQARADNGCMVPVTRNAALDTAAQKHSVWQDETQTMRHDGRGGTNAGQRITAEGYRWSTWGENVAYGYSTADAVMTAWMNSPPHKANILNCKFKEIGMGLQGSKYYWTQDFATKQ